MLRSFLKKVKNNTPIHSVAILAEDLSFCRGVVGGGYTADIQAYSFKTYTPHTQKSEKRERERNENHANQVMLGSVGISKNELRVEYFSILAKSPHVNFFPETQWIHYKMQWFQFERIPHGTR